MDAKKSLVLFFSAFFAFGAAYAQRFEVTSAYNYEQAFLRDKNCNDLKKGLAAIGSALKDPKTKDEAKTWYYNGNIYFDISTSKDAKCNSLAKDAADKAMDSYVKTMKLDFKDTSYHNLDIQNNQNDARKFLMGFVGAVKGNVDVENTGWFIDIIKNRFPYLGNEFYNKGVAAYSKSHDYKSAFKNFSKAAMISQFTAMIKGKLDTTVIYNMALSAQSCKDTSIHNQAIPLYKQLIAIGYKGQGSQLYLNLYHLQMAAGDTAKAYATLQAGRKAMPKDAGLIRTTVDYNLQSGKDSSALKSLTLAMQNGKATPLLLFARGAVYDKMKKYDKAIADYKAAIADSANYYDPYYNLGALYFNKGADLNNQSNKLPFSKIDQIKKLQAEAKVEFKKAQPYLEKAHQIKPKERSAVVSLLKVYSMTNQQDKFKALKASFGK